MTSRASFLRPACLLTLFALSASVTAVACIEGSQESAPREKEKDVAASSPIINGQLDTTHDAVVAVLGNDFSCSGTIIQVAGGQGYVLTAAHCCNPGDEPTFVVIGPDYQTGDGFNVVPGSVARDGCYTDCAGSTDDVCMLRFSGADGSTPVIPAMSPATDALAINTQVTYVGYGITSSPPGGFNHKRRFVTKSIGSLDAYFIEYADPGSSGTCEGDSGGPGLVSVGGVEMVAGVTSFGDQDCVALGASIRTSSTYTNFIAPYLADMPPIGGACPISTNCNACLSDTTNPQCGGGCADSLNACTNDAACGALLDCYNACGTSLCQQGCSDDHTAGLQKYEKVLECICNDSCSSACGTNQLCTANRCGTLTTPETDACESCIDASCCDATWTCSRDPSCKKCFGSNPPAGCASQPDVQAYAQCVNASCAGTCPTKNPGSSGSASDVTGAGVGGAGAGGSTAAGHPDDGDGSGGNGTIALRTVDSGCSCSVTDDDGSPALAWAGVGLAFIVARRVTKRARSPRAQR